ncbi:hypothetical protein [Hydrogenophaga sp.]|uniref:hypothetical protein n=1 Tax=Hydrogenophaga sp. TaxID=1904254 RepID=UPI00286E0087|nr:hypothetical protein [Hydrogenophaga sp.]
MIVARWQVNARFGHKQELIDEIRNWWQTVGRDIGQTNTTILTGSVGAAESLVTVDVRCADMAELQSQWDQLAHFPEHKAFSLRVEPLLVSGSTRWDILKVVT